MFLISILVATLSKLSLSDRIQMGLLLAAVIGIALTYWQVRSNARTHRAVFLKELYFTVTSDTSICEAYYAIEYERFRYGPDFHGSQLEPKIDRLLSFADLVCDLYSQRVIKKHEMAFFRYRFLRIAQDANIREYLAFLVDFYSRVGIAKRPYHSFLAYSEKLKNSQNIEAKQE